MIGGHGGMCTRIEDDGSLLVIRYDIYDAIPGDRTTPTEPAYVDIWQVRSDGIEVEVAQAWLREIEEELLCSHLSLAEVDYV